MQAYSFDIFDTCLVRKCGEPSNVFDLVADRVFCQSVISTEEKRMFVAARLEADAKTWSATQKLTDIYDAFEMEHPALLPKEQLLEMERTVEGEMLVAVPEMVAKINALRYAGHRIIFISDMYLNAEFLQSVLIRQGLWKEGDGLYVSCEVGATKVSGDLFRYIQQKENISYSKWHHYGDNEKSDVEIPKRLGIHAHKVAHGYTPYQIVMREKPSLYFQWGSMMAGLSRCVALQSVRSAHKDFVLDIIAPLFTSFVCRVMDDAHERGVKNLYFCARDTYPIYRIAKRLESLYANVKVHYLYISRKSLYEGDDAKKIGYYHQIGLASKQEGNAIVDIRSTGKTLNVLNELLVKNGYQQVFGYFFEICSNETEQRKGLQYYAELDDLYISNSSALRKVPNNWYLYELFFPLNTQKKTIGYELREREYVPSFEPKDNKEYRLRGLKEYAAWRERTFDIYADFFISLQLYKYADEIFMQYVIPQMAEFFLYPHKHYLKALSEFYGLDPEKGYIPYVDKSIWRLPMNVLKHRTMWKRGTVFYSLPTWLSKWLYKRK